MGLPWSDDVASPNDDNENIGVVAWNAAIRSAQPACPLPQASLDIDDDNMGAVGGGVIAVYGEHF